MRPRCRKDIATMAFLYSPIKRRPMKVTASPSFVPPVATQRCVAPSMAELYPGHCVDFKRDFHKFHYADQPFVGATVQIDRRNHPGAGWARTVQQIKAHACAGENTEFSGEKVHVSVSHHQVAEAYTAIAPKLFKLD